MAGDWSHTNLGNVVELKRGYDLPQQARTPGTVPLVSSSGVTDHHSKAMVKGPGVVTGRYGTLGQVFYIETDFWPLNTTLYVRDFKGNDPRFISYFLRSLDFQAYSDKAAVPGLNRNHLHQSEVLVPTDLDEQRAIAGVLSTLDDKIELNRRENETLEGIARAIFKSWFVDFDPVRAKRDARALSGLPANVAALFPASLVESELGPIPAGWHAVAVNQVAKVNELTLNANDTLDPLHYIDISSVNAGEVSDVMVFPRGSEPSRARRRLQHGDTVMSTVRPNRGSYFLALKPLANLIASTGFATVSPKKVPWSFLHAALTRRGVFEYLGHVADGAAYPAVRPSVVETLELVRPEGDEVLEAFHELAAPLLEKMEASRQESSSLTHLRNQLLPKLISGELRVKNAETSKDAVV